MGHISRTGNVLLLCSIALALGNDPGAAQPVVREVLDRVETERNERSISIHVYFRFPVHYVRHFPYESGDTLLVHVTPTAFEPLEKESRGREALRPPQDPDVPLTDIVFDSRTLWNPYLMLHFSRRVDFRVRQGSDARSIVVELPVALQPAPSPARATEKSEPRP